MSDHWLGWPERSSIDHCPSTVLTVPAVAEYKSSMSSKTDELATRSLTAEQMLGFLSKSISSLNENKLRGLIAEVRFREQLLDWGLSSRVSPGGWIFRSNREHAFANTIAVFAEPLSSGQVYGDLGGMKPDIPHRMHAICNNLQQTGIESYYACPVVANADPDNVQWRFVRLGVPEAPVFQSAADIFDGRFSKRKRRYNWLRYHHDLAGFPADALADEYSKESLRIHVLNNVHAEVSDLDGVFWGKRKTYPLEIKEKALGTDSDGPYFGIDIGPFAKLSFFNAMRGNLDGLFIVRQVEPDSRVLISWRYATFENMARYASWVPRAGGRSMTGGASAVLKLPEGIFGHLSPEALEGL